MVEAPRLVTSPETGGYGLSWCSAPVADRGRLVCSLGNRAGQAVRRVAVAGRRCHRGIAGRRPCRPVDGERGKRPGGARRPRGVGAGAGAPSAVAAGAWRSRRSTPRPGEPAAWGRAAANTRHVRGPPRRQRAHEAVPLLPDVSPPLAAGVRLHARAPADRAGATDAGESARPRGERFVAAAVELGYTPKSARSDFGPQVLLRDADRVRQHA